MTPHPTTEATAALCQRLLADPAIDSPLRALAGQVLALIESVRHDGANDPFYEDCIRHLALDIAA
jgi:hypothetical protein